MQPLSYITDTQGNRTALILNISNYLESRILNLWLNQPDEKRNIVNLYFAKFLYETTTDSKEKKELESIINELKNSGIADNLDIFHTAQNSEKLQKL